MFGSALVAASNCVLRFGELAGVEEDDALVVGRLGAAAAAGCAGVLRRVGAGFGRQVELLLRVVDVGEAGIRVGRVGLQLDRLLERGLGLGVLLLGWRGRRRCCSSSPRRWVPSPITSWNLAMASSWRPAFIASTADPPVPAPRRPASLSADAHPGRGAQREGQRIVRALPHLSASASACRPCPSTP